MQSWDYKKLKAEAYRCLFEHHIKCYGKTGVSSIISVNGSGWLSVSDIALFGRQDNGLDYHNFKVKILTMMVREGTVIMKTCKKIEYWPYGSFGASRHDPLQVYRIATPIEIAQRKSK